MCVCDVWSAGFLWSNHNKKATQICQEIRHIYFRPSSATDTLYSAMINAAYNTCTIYTYSNLLGVHGEPKNPSIEEFEPTQNIILFPIQQSS